MAKMISGVNLYAQLETMQLWVEISWCENVTESLEDLP